jgi:hypothetical protein
MNNVDFTLCPMQHLDKWLMSLGDGAPAARLKMRRVGMASAVPVVMLLAAERRIEIFQCTAQTPTVYSL